VPSVGQMVARLHVLRYKGDAGLRSRLYEISPGWAAGQSLRPWSAGSGMRADDGSKIPCTVPNQPHDLLEGHLYTHGRS
jgi:hypothetical protein